MRITTFPHTKTEIMLIMAWYHIKKKKKKFVFNFLTKFITFEKFSDCIKTTYNIMFIKIVSMFRIVAFNATFNNISVISWPSVLLVVIFLMWYQAIISIISVFVWGNVVILIFCDFNIVSYTTQEIPSYFHEMRNTMFSERKPKSVLENPSFCWRILAFLIFVTIAYNDWCCEFESRSGRGVQHYVIKFVRNLRQVGFFLRVLWFPPQIKLTVTI
jgi:hypothetical protein